MEHKGEAGFLLTRDKMLGYIRDGRKAIEYSMLLVLMRPRAQTKEDEAEMAELRTLSALYNKMMAQHELPKIDATPANDEKGAID